MLDEAVKGVAFHEQQLARFQQFHGRVHTYVEEVRQEANQLAIAGVGMSAEHRAAPGAPWGRGEEVLWGSHMEEAVWQ